MVQVKVVNKGKQELPKYATIGSAGMDLRANLEEPMVLKRFERKLIPTGIYIQLPEGYEAQVRPRSGLALKHGLIVPNSPGTVDSDYTGEVCVMLLNLGENDFIINPGERIAQMIVSKYEHVDWVPVNELEKTERGDGGFGHTGVK